MRYGVRIPNLSDLVHRAVITLAVAGLAEMVRILAS
jgi:hypothetical protein